MEKGSDGRENKLSLRRNQGNRKMFFIECRYYGRIAADCGIWHTIPSTFLPLERERK